MSYQTVGIMHFNSLTFGSKLAVVRRHGKIFGISTDATIVAYIARYHTDKGEKGYTCKWESFDAVVVELQKDKEQSYFERGNRAEKIGDTLRLIDRVLNTKVSA